MKTKILFLGLAWFLSMGHALADSFVISNVTVQQGGTASLSIGYNFTSATDKVGFSFSLGLPDGLSLQKDGDGDPVYVKDASINKLNINFAGEDKSNVAGMPSTESATISGTSGTLLTLTLVADAGLEVGAEYIIPVTKATFQQRVEGSTTDINIADFSFKVTVGEPDDGRIHFDETATTLPTYSAGGKGDITMKRTIKAGNWSTIVLPFNLTRANATAIFGSDAEYAQFNGFEVDYGDDPDNITPLSITINFSSYTIPARGNLAGGTPILIKTNQNITEPFTLDQVTLTEGVSDVEKVFLVDGEYPLNGKFTGSLVKTTVPTDGLFLNSNKFYYAEEPLPINAFRGWFELDAVLSKETDFGVKLFIDGFETKVNGLSVKDATGTIFDLSGRRVTKPQQNGVYIVNGKKVYVK